MHVVVCTVVHHPGDARIYYRQIRALLDAGHQVTYIAPHDEDQSQHYPERAGDSPQPVTISQAVPAPTTVTVPPAVPEPNTVTVPPAVPAPTTVTVPPAVPALTTITIPRAVGRRRVGALRAAKAALAAYAPSADLLLVHDPELLLVLPPRRRRPPTVWDVHEDTAAALTTKAWLPKFLRPVAAGGVIFAERLAERRLHLILAEHGYNARFRQTHPVVPNTTYVPSIAAPPSGPRRVVYVGHLSPDRGSAEMVSLARLFAPHGIAVELIGPADAAAQANIKAGGDLVHWHGFVPNEQALRLTEGALAGLSLLHDEANFRRSMPTKVIEYMAHGVPVITTPLPLAVDLVRSAECGFVVPFGDVQAACDAVLSLDRDPDLRVKMGLRGHDAALRSLGWPADARAFVAQLESWTRRT